MMGIRTFIQVNNIKLEYSFNKSNNFKIFKDYKEIGVTVLLCQVRRMFSFILIPLILL